MTYRTANSAVEGDLSEVRSPYGAVLRRGYGVDDCGLAGLDLDLLDEGVDEGPGFGQLAGLEELAHLLGEGGDDIGAVQHHPSVGEQGPRLLCGYLQLLLALPVLPDAVRGVGHLDVGRLDDVPYAAQLPLHVLKLLLDALQPLPLLSRHSVHLLVQQLH